MGADDGAIDDVQTPVEPTLGIDLSLQRSEDAIPHPGLLLPGEARRDRLPRAVTLGQGAPGAAGAQEPENAVGDAAMVVVRTTGAPQAWLRRVATSVARAVSAARRKRRCVQASTRLPSWQVTSWCIRTSAVQAGCHSGGRHRQLCWNSGGSLHHPRGFAGRGLFHQAARSATCKEARGGPRGSDWSANLGQPASPLRGKWGPHGV